MSKKFEFPIRKSNKKPSLKRSELIAQKRKELEALENEGDTPDLIARAIEITEMLEQAKELYKERDEIVEQLLESGKTQFEHEGIILTLVDTFAKSNKQWKSVPFNRFIIEIT